MLKVFVLFLLLFPISVVGQAQAPAPAEAVKAFYTFHLAHDMGFTKPNVVQRKRWLSPGLYQLLLNEFRREAAYARSHPREDFVPHMDGDPFTDSQDTPNSFEVGETSINGPRAQVRVTLKWSGGDDRNLNVDLMRAGDSWLIDNILDVSEKQDLRKDLTRAKYLP